HLPKLRLKFSSIRGALHFKSLCNKAVLERKAKQMLENNLSIGDISQALGFSEVREFRLAFKRWTGQAPSVYKNVTE
ncbi:helix-turn-helix domain-containing protein, partial [Acinetobacter johnsonii]|uniref:helix-turn-helix domain-containing protein n=1 Tax=Acinetobacter johnsonii TaxID=40214 RepID=UPI00280D2C73